MAVVEYKLEREPLTGVLAVPPFVKNGGYWPLPDNTLVGWSFIDEKVNFVLPATAKVLTKKMFVDRQLANIVEGQTVEQVTADTETWYDEFVTSNLTDSTIDLAYAKKQRIQQAFSVLEDKLANVVVNVEIASSGNEEPFGCDNTTQNNIIGINAAIAVGVSIPNPMYWTPKGSTTPVAVTHQELADIGSALLNKKNDFYQVYFTHKANINNIANLVDLYKYDYSTGY